jgi:3-oxoacyl-[acyl-carrier-protein] synthase III
MNSIIESTGHYLPTNNITSQEMEKIISKTFPDISYGILEEMT